MCGVMQQHLNFGDGNYCEQNQPLYICICMQNNSCHGYQKNWLLFLLSMRNFFCRFQIVTLKATSSLPVWCFSLGHVQWWTLTCLEPLLKHFFMYCPNPLLEGNFIKSAWLYVTRSVHLESIKFTNWVLWNSSMSWSENWIVANNWIISSALLFIFQYFLFFIFFFFFFWKYFLLNISSHFVIYWFCFKYRWFLFIRCLLYILTMLFFWLGILGIIFLDF